MFVRKSYVWVTYCLKAETRMIMLHEIYNKIYENNSTHFVFLLGNLNASIEYDI